MVSGVSQQEMPGLPRRNPAALGGAQARQAWVSLLRRAAENKVRNEALPGKRGLWAAPSSPSVGTAPWQPSLPTGKACDLRPDSSTPSRPGARPMQGTVTTPGPASPDGWSRTASSECPSPTPNAEPRGRQGGLRAPRARAGQRHRLRGWAVPPHHLLPLRPGPGVGFLWPRLVPTPVAPLSPLATGSTRSSTASCKGVGRLLPWGFPNTYQLFWLFWPHPGQAQAGQWSIVSQDLLPPEEGPTGTTHKAALVGGRPGGWGSVGSLTRSHFRGDAEPPELWAD